VPLDIEAERRKLADMPSYLLKVMPHVDGTARVCELLRFYLRDVSVLVAWTGLTALELHPHPAMWNSRGRRQCV
jgi:acetoacetate decarboxylase